MRRRERPLRDSRPQLEQACDIFREVWDSRFAGIASLDLSGVSWVVLSACDTGLGEVRAGEGVMGLRRALHVAGVRTVIMSLWSVGDEPARAWMRALYEGRLRDGLGTAESVRHADLSRLRARREAGESTHPFFWTGFVAIGDWR